MALRKLWKFVGSRRFAIYLLITLIAFAVTGMLIPQDSPVNTEAYQSWAIAHPQLNNLCKQAGLTQLFTSPIFVFITGILLASLVICTFRQIIRTYRLLHSPSFLTPPMVQPLIVDPPGSTMDFSLLSGLLRKRGYLSTKYDAENNLFLAQRWLIGYWGSVVLHLGFVVIILGILISGLTKMQGYLYLGEGQTIQEEQASYWQLTTGPWFIAHKGFGLALDKLEVAFPPKSLPYVSTAYLSVKDGSYRFKKAIADNENLNYRGVKFFPDSHGYAVALVVTDQKKQIVDSNFFHLRTSVKYTQEKYSVSSSLPKLDWQLAINFFPDFQLKDGIMSNKTLRPVRPALWLSIKQQNKQLYEGPLPLGSRIELGDKLLFFPEFRNNLGFSVVSDQGTPIIFTGFWLSIVGLVLIYFLSPVQLCIQLEDTLDRPQLLLWGRSSRFPLSYRNELSDIAQTINATTREDHIERGT